MLFYIILARFNLNMNIKLLSKCFDFFSHETIFDFQRSDKSCSNKQFPKAIYVLKSANGANISVPSVSVYLACLF